MPRIHGGLKEMERRQHWESVYGRNDPELVSWYQSRPATSLALIEATGCGIQAGIIDVGGGASTLVDALLDAGHEHVAVLDIAASALRHARNRLGQRAVSVEWIEADVLRFRPPHRFALWHDRAVFHFLVSAEDRAAYVSTLLHTLAPGGHVIIATFAPDGPARCSGLDVVRYDEAAMTAALGLEFRLQESRRETHLTPWQAEQRFIYFRFTHEPGDGTHSVAAAGGGAGSSGSTNGVV